VKLWPPLLSLLPLLLHHQCSSAPSVLSAASAIATLLLLLPKLPA